jgi:hypothetical protein
MLPYAIFAQDLARERNRELDRTAARHRLLTGLRSYTTAAKPGRVRTLVARPVRTFSNVTRFVADAARTAATRLEGRST